MNLVVPDNLRYALRLIRRSPLLSSVIVLVFALGIGANTVVFSVVNAVLLRSLPYPDPDKLLVLAETKAGSQDALTVSFPVFREWKEQAKSFEQVAAYSTRSFNLVAGDEPQRVAGEIISPGYFATLQSGLQIGREFRPEQAIAGSAPLVIISDAIWRRYYEARQDVLGKTILINDQAFTVTGVTTPEFRSLGYKTEIWIPTGAAAIFAGSDVLNNRGASWLVVIGRLKPGCTRQMARQELTSFALENSRLYPLTHRDKGVQVIPLADYVGAASKSTLLLLLAGVSVVLIVACVNIAVLTIARNARRERETAIRVALGSGFGQLARTIFTENILLAVLGGIAGMVLALIAAPMIATSGIKSIPRLEEVTIDSRVLLFSMALSFLAGIVVSVIPLRHARAVSLEQVLRDADRGGSGGRRVLRTRAVLLIAQIAFSFVLLTTAALLIRALRQVERIDPGFLPQGLAVVRLSSVSATRYAEPDALVRYYEQILEEVKTIPGVRLAAASTYVPLISPEMTINFSIPGAARAAMMSIPSAHYVAVTDDYFKAMSIPLLRGRLLEPSDTAATLPVIVVNQTFARTFFPDTNALGAPLALSDSGDARQIVGIVGDIRQQGLTESVKPEMYVSYRQVPAGFLSFFRSFPMTFVVRAEIAPDHLFSGLQNAVHRIDRYQALYPVRTMDTVVDETIARPRIHALVLTVFSFLALVLIAAGIYGITSESVVQRTREMAIRIALGAAPVSVAGIIARKTLLLTLAGLGIGTAISSLTWSFLRTLLYGVQPGKLTTLAATAALILLVCAVASFRPVWRAAGINPVESLRHE